MSGRPRTLLDRIWERHAVVQRPQEPAVLAIDLHLVHEVTSPQAFDGLRARGLSVRRPDLTLATIDHSLPTKDRSLPMTDRVAAHMITVLQENCAAFGIPLMAPGSGRQGIVHVIGPELGLTQPGMTMVCGDSHTATHGAFGALAFGIGTSEVEMVLASQCLLQYKPKAFQVRFDGQLQPGVSAKDMILALLARIGVDGGRGSVFEFCGAAVAALSMEARMTLCNMSIEGGARTGMVAPDDTTFQYLARRPGAPQGAAWESALAQWRELRTEAEASFDNHIVLDATTLEPMITFGTNPGMAMPVGAAVPDPGTLGGDAGQALQQALTYMGLEPGRPLCGHPVQVVFLGSCTNGRIEDLREAAAILRDRRIHAGVRMLVVPGSEGVKQQAEAEGLDAVFLQAGAEWRDPGCSLCIAMNGDILLPGEMAVSTSNRNFEGRQGPGSRTILASPATAAASALAGAVADPRRCA